jgi:hypothetical protein
MTSQPPDIALLCENFKILNSYLLHIYFKTRLLYMLVSCINQSPVHVHIFRIICKPNIVAEILKNILSFNPSYSAHGQCTSHSQPAMAFNSCPAQTNHSMGQSHRRRKGKYKMYSLVCTIILL